MLTDRSTSSSEVLSSLRALFLTRALVKFSECDRGRSVLAREFDPEGTAR